MSEYRKGYFAQPLLQVYVKKGGCTYMCRPETEGFKCGKCLTGWIASYWKVFRRKCPVCKAHFVGAYRYKLELIK